MPRIRVQATAGDEERFEKSNFVPLEDASSGLDGATEQTFGPLAILAAGLAPQEFAEPENADERDGCG